jgi:hypothetical protein
LQVIIEGIVALSRSKIHNSNNLESYIKDSAITEYGWKSIQNLSKTVCFRYYRTYDVDDLISLAITDLAEFLFLLEKSDNIPRNIRNVLFTRARNTMSNYLYHRRKDVPTEDDLLDTQVSKECYTDELPIKYEFSTLEEAHLLSLKLWRMYEGEKDNSDSLE